jgi:adenosylhomocysteine nucleosidase
MPQPAYPRPGRILVLAALPYEVRPFLRRRRARRRRDLGVPAWDFDLAPEGQGQGLLALSGMGAAAGRRQAEALLQTWQPQVLVSMGFAGALTPEVPPGALLLGESYWHYLPETQTLSPAAAPPRPRPVPELLASFVHAGLPALAGAVVTTPAILVKAGLPGLARSLSHPVLDLETAVLADLAAAAGLPFACLRAVTDGAAEEIPEFVRTSAHASPGPGAALAWVAQDFRRAATLFQLWRRSRAAAAALARGLAALLPLLLRGDEFQDEPAEKRQVDKDSGPT